MKSAFIIIDVQAEWAGKNPYTTAAIKRAADIARKTMPVLWVYFSDFRIQFSSQAAKVQDNHAYPAFNNAVLNIDEYKPAIAPAPDDWIVTKDSLSMFSNPATEATLKKMGVDNLIFAGFETSACLHFSATEAVMKGFNATAVLGLMADYEDRNFSDGIPELQAKGIQIALPQTLGF